MPLRLPRVRMSGDAGFARTTVLLSLAGVVVVGGGAAAALSVGGSSVTGAIGLPQGSPTPPPPPARVVLASTGSQGQTVPWSMPLRLTVSGGTLTVVTATGPGGAAVPGSLSPTGWASAGTLVPSSRYIVHATYRDSDGSTKTLDRTVVTTPPTATLKAFFYPRGTVGVGQPLIIRFDHRIDGAAARAAAIARLTVTTSPAVKGAWRFLDSYEAHFRPAKFWTPGTTMTARADLAGMRLPGTGTWGQTAAETATMRIGDALVSTVDITAHTMTIRKNGTVLRTVPVSTGRAEYPTKGGVHIVLTVEREHLYDSSTVGIPTASPDGYYEKLPYSMRISYGGAFVHANPATVKYQGRLNVSHGCINLSLADAKWFYGVSHRGDVVDVIHAEVGPVLDDPGMADWNYPWEAWQKGNLGS